MLTLALAFLFTILLVLTGAAVSCALALRRIALALRFMECLADDGPLTDIHDVLRDRLPEPVELTLGESPTAKHLNVTSAGRAIAAVDIDRQPTTPTPRRRRTRATTTA